MVLATLREGRFQLKGMIEVILDGRLAATGHEDEILDPSGTRFVDGILHQWLIHDSEHLLRHCLCRRQKPRAEAPDRENCCFDGASCHALAFSVD